MAKATNLMKKEQNKPSAKIVDGRCHFIVTNVVHIHLKPASICGIDVVGGGDGERCSTPAGSEAAESGAAGSGAAGFGAAALSTSCLI